jgi:transcriptional regulator with XRE-family HTH domain
MVTEEDLRQRLSTNVRAHRLAASLTQREAAARAHMNVHHRQKIEAGMINISLHTLARLSVALRVHPKDLLCEHPPHEAQDKQTVH